MFDKLQISRLAKFKNASFYWVKKLSKSNRTRCGVSPVFVEYRAKRVFAIDFVAKKLVCHMEICEFHD